MEDIDEKLKEQREAEFGPAVVLDTDLRRLHAEGRTSDAMRRIQEFADTIRLRALEEARAVAISQSNFGHVEGNRRAFLIASLIERRQPLITAEPNPAPYSAGGQASK